MTAWAGAGRTALRRLLASALTAVALPLAALAQAPESPTPAPEMVTIPKGEARILMMKSAADGRYDLARALALGLIKAAPDDGQAHYILARANRALGRPVEARQAAARSYRLASSPLQRFQAAQIAAGASVDARHYTLGQLWLRRTYENAPNEAARAAIARDYRMLRQVNPLSFSFSFSVSPSTNFNNGSSSALNDVDGVDGYFGSLSSDAQALPGNVVTTQARLSYRLSDQRAEGATTVSLLGYAQRVLLTEETRDKAPTAEAGDYDMTQLELSLRRRQPLTETIDVSAGLALGTVTYGGEPYYDYRRIELGYGALLTPRSHVSAYATAEQRDFPLSSRPEGREIRLGAGWRTRVGDAGTLGLSLGYEAEDRTGPDFDNESLSMSLSWSPAQAWGPARMTFSLDGRVTDYPDYRVVGLTGLGLVAVKVPGGREDRSLSLTARARFDDLGYAGFVPVVTVTGKRQTSNVTRFETEGVSVRLGIESAF
ncbi:hypothetical protein [Mesobacterium pallidum]|uniref:hypothetical protein n=1 Tax=Mesobacterium pallidum TaxID=2872037 RepID=UPI001EE34EF0|nr:hypothetical protein [Mesobacterium pallidum]